MSVDNAERMAEARRKLLEQRLKGKHKATSEPPPLPKFAAGEPVPATFGQRSLWFVQQMAPQSAAYNMGNAMVIEGELDIDALQKSLDTVVARHEVLRTNFVSTDDGLEQIIHAPQPAHFEVVDIAPQAVRAELSRLVELPFDLADDALFRSYVLRESDIRATLLMVMHHIISDKWSLEVLIWRELSACYAAYTQGREPDLPQVSAQFSEFTAWQMQKLDAPAHQKQLDYWRETLADAPALLQLPHDHPRPAKQDFEGEVLYDALPAEDTRRLQTLSKEAGTTAFMVLLAAYALLLHRMSRQDDLIIGTSVDMRTHAQLEHTIGYFLNSVVLRQTFDREYTFLQLLDDVQQQMLHAFSNKEVEFEQVVQALHPVRDPSYNPIFQTMFNMWDETDNTPHLPGLSLQHLKIDPDITKFDLTLYAQINLDGTLMIASEYATSLFERGTMTRLLELYKTLIRSILAAPDAPLHQLDWLPHDQQDLLLNQWTKTAQPFPQEQLVHDLIAQHPADAVAVRMAEQAVTYGELNQQANQLAHWLVEHGAVPNQPIGLMVERSPEMLVGIVGILRSGAAYVPIDPAYPDERIQFMLEDAGIQLLLTQSHLDLNLPDGITKLYVNDPAHTTGKPVTAPATDVTPDDLAYIIYTSGSTGKPKGVRATHRNLVHSTTARYQVYEHPIERFLLLSSYAFDSSLVGIFWSMCGGGTLCLPPQDGEKDVAQLARLIAEYGVTHLLALPSLYRILLDFADAHQLQSLNTVIVAGEACPPALVTAHYHQLPHAKLYNEYGPTEGTVWATMCEIPPHTERVHIGRAIPNMQTYIVDDQLRPVPIGVAGELLIGGVGITQGYHNRPQLTDERFIANPFGAGRLYRTGDLARYLPDGNIEFLGRVDHQVKVSGYRVELGEIENALAAMDGIDEAVVLAEALNNQLQLVAFVDTSRQVEGIRAALRQHLPHYMVPSQIIALEAIPRTPNGKVNRAALLASIESIPMPSVKTAQANDVIERELVTIWEDLLGVPVPDTNADFFALGGYSLLAIRMFARVKQAFNKEFPVSTILEAPTVASLAAAIREDTISEKSLITLQANGTGTPVYCFQVNRFGVIHYRELANRLGTDRPVYGVVLPGESDEQKYVSIDTISQQFAAAIRQQQPQGPYYLVGLSVAGLVAYEVGRLLRRDDQTVQVFMMDTQGPDYPTSQPLGRALRQRASAFWQRFRAGTTQDRLQQLQYAAWMWRYRLGFQLRKRSNWLLATLNLPLIEDHSKQELRVGGEDVHQQLREYHAADRSSDVPILIYRGEMQPISSVVEWALGWDKYVDDEHITIVPVRGPHTDLLQDPYVRPIAAHLRQWLAEHDA